MTIGDALKIHDDSLEIVMSVLNTDRSFVLLNKGKNLSSEDSEKILQLITKRKAGVPLAYVTNQRGFWRNIFYVNEDVLIPQPDTETLVEKAVEFLSKTDSCSLSVLDLCAGSGCIGISVANELAKLGKKVNLTLSDISKGAYEVFSKNADELLDKTVTVHKVNADLFEGVQCQKFDCILTNPPYIDSYVIPTLSTEVQAEPMLALDGGKDGLEIVGKIARQSSGYLNENGFVLCEIGYDQGKTATEIFGQYCKNTELFKDLGNNDRVVKASF